MPRMSRWVLMVALILVTKAVAFAGGGTKVMQDVSITKGSDLSPEIMVATGSLGSARNNGATSTAKEIGCKVVPSRWGVLTTCSAHSAGATPPDLQCTTTNATMAAIVGSLNGDSVLGFYTFLSDINMHPDMDYDPGECVVITVENSSKYESKQP